MTKYPQGISPGRSALSGNQDKQATGSIEDLVKKVLGDPALYPDEFVAWLPTALRYNVNFKVLQASLPPNGTRHTVGGAGESAVFTNSWVAFGSTSEVPNFWIDPFGHVHLDGVAKSGTVNTGATGSIFTLPAGFRPRAILNFPVASNNAYGTCIVNPDGTVIAATGSNVYFSLSGISFRQFS